MVRNFPWGFAVFDFPSPSLRLPRSGSSCFYLLLLLLLLLGITWRGYYRLLRSSLMSVNVGRAARRVLVVWPLHSLTFI